MNTFAQYMEQTLYGPGGYYASGAVPSGLSGDYFTAPDVGPVFGRLLAALFVHWAERLASRPFHLVEVGAGEGRCARAIGQALAADHAGRFDGLAYAAIEQSPARRRMLEGTAPSMPCPFQISPDLSFLCVSPVVGCLFANELIDAFPVHRVRMTHGRLEEAYVERTSEGNRFVWAEPSTPRLEAYFSRLGIRLPENYETEINLAMGEWLGQAAQALSSGLVLLIDYGRPAPEYYHPERSQGTLRAFHRHRVRRDVLADEVMDLTADVDFTSLALEAKEAGLIPLAYMDMAAFLVMATRLLFGRRLETDLGSLIGLSYLVHPEGMGGAFQALVLGKGIDPRDWPFEGNRLGRLGFPDRMVGS